MEHGGPGGQLHPSRAAALPGPATTDTGGRGPEGPLRGWGEAVRPGHHAPCPRRIEVGAWSEQHPELAVHEPRGIGEAPGAFIAPAARFLELRQVIRSVE